MNETQIIKFDTLGISLSILKALRDMGFESATTIQSESIKIMKSGKDVIAQSQTGTGKTAAFGIPCIESIDSDNKNIQCVVLCPTRELAIQINNEFIKLLKYSHDIKTLAIYGGQSFDNQTKALKKGVQVVIGTPGRIMDHMRRKTIKFDNLKTIVLDEADEMLDMGFREDIETILKEMPEEHQMMMYSATLSKEIMKLSENYTNDPEIIKVEARELTSPNIEQSYFCINGREKFDSLINLLNFHNPETSIIFCNTKRYVDNISEMLKSKGFEAEGLHGDLRQDQRDKVMASFRNQRTKILVATDIAARGIDVSNVDIIFNYDMPSNGEYYTHRIGRTGRAGKKGKAYTFVVGKEINKIAEIVHFTKSKIKAEKIPTKKDIMEIQSKSFLSNINDLMKEDLDEYIKYVDKNFSNSDLKSLSAALLKLAISENNLDDKIEVVEVEEKRSELFTRPKNNKEKDSRNSKMVKLQINVGKKFKIKPFDILAMITNENNLSSKNIGDINIFDEYSIIEVKRSNLETIFSATKNKKIKGKKVKVSFYDDIVKQKNKISS